MICGKEYCGSDLSDHSLNGDGHSCDQLTPGAYTYRLHNPLDIAAAFTSR
jgi:hypothetical protein